jgi:[protein-PII] uridylyltransferase
MSASPAATPAGSASAGEAGGLPHWRSVLEQNQRELADAFDANVDIDELIARRTRAVDEAVIAAFDATFGPTPALSLIATGGYGRSELFPRSDVDLLILADEAVQHARQTEIEAFFAGLWNLGIAPGHAVRSLAQCIEAARDDVTVATALLEIRPLAGEPQGCLQLRDAMRTPELWPPAAFFAAKRAEWNARHARYHDTAYNLEPNLKEGPGGLRDLHTLAWMAQRLFGVARLAELLPLGALGADEFDILDTRRRSLSRLRFGLHLVAERREERLLFDYQKQLAARLGLRDEHRDNLAVEQLMQDYFRSAALVLRIGERLLQRFAEGLAEDAPMQAIDADFISIDGFLALRDPELLFRRPTTILSLFRVWQQHPQLRGLHSSTARALGEALSRVDDRFRAEASVKAMFLNLLRDPGAIPTLERMAKLGVLGRYLPAFGKVSGRMQYDLFHVYTVDQHTLTVLRNMASFAESGSTQRFALGHELWPQLRKPELLLLAGLFHDIAKGRGGDHSELGAIDARRFCLDHGLSAADTDLVAWLVRHHLAMSVTAQRQDISDSEVVKRFATLVGELERLDYLYLLTVADIAGTSPKLWNAWKDRLMADLYTATRFALRRGLEHPVHADERVAESRDAARARLHGLGLDDARIDQTWAEFPDESFLRYRAEQIAWQTHAIASTGDEQLPLVVARPHARPGALEVFVYSPDRDGLFATVAAALDRLGLSIVEARVVNSRRGISLDTFQVLDAGVDFIDPERRAASVSEAVREALRHPAEKRSPARRALPRQLKHFRVPASIEFAPAEDSAPDSIGGRTQMTLVCSDRPGLLAQVAAVLREHRLRVHDARIATFGERVEDFFLLTDETDTALDADRCEALRTALLAALETP